MRTTKVIQFHHMASFIKRNASVKIEIDKHNISHQLQPQQFYVNTGTIVNMSF